MKTLINNYLQNKKIVKTNLIIKERISLTLDALLIALLTLIPLIFFLTPFYLDINLQIVISILLILIVSLDIIFYQFLKHYFYQKKINISYNKLELIIFNSLILIIPTIIVGIILMIIFL